MSYRVTAGYVNVEVAGVETRFVRGTVLPADADVGQVMWEMNLCTVEWFGESTSGDEVHLPEGMSVSSTLQWAGSNAVRAQAALDEENGKPLPRATLVDRLEAVIAAAEDKSADSGAGASVDS